MIEKLKELFKYRQLIITLVARELKARYRGTVFGFFWSFLNPLLLLLVYSVVFGIILPQSSGRIQGIDFHPVPLGRAEIVEIAVVTQSTLRSREIT